MCGSCLSLSQRGSSSDPCPTCGSTSYAEVSADDHIIGFSSHSLPCPGCFRPDQPVVFRGWSRVWGLLFWASEQRRAAYLCRNCAQRETIASLLFTALLGWWSIPSFFFYGPRATYFNWRSVFTPPAYPGDWGAISVEEFLHDMRRESQEPVVDGIEDSPLRFLSASEQELVLRSSGLYELLEVARSSNESEIRAAYRAKAKAYHPDVTGPDPHSVNLMVEINQAWEVLGSHKLRQAYDWLEENR